MSEYQNLTSSLSSSLMVGFPNYLLFFYLFMPKEKKHTLGVFTQSTVGAKDLLDILATLWILEPRHFPLSVQICHCCKINAIADLMLNHSVNLYVLHAIQTLALNENTQHFSDSSSYPMKSYCFLPLISLSITI